jgi:menaquinone-dependent protoporphyrinogen oxidase
MAKILVAYATMSGTTGEVAQAVAEEVAKGGLQVEVFPLSQVKALDPYAAVVIGAPMIMGWHRAALGFLKKHRRAFQRLPLAVFATAMSLTDTGETVVDGIPVFVDQELPRPPEKEGNLNFRERYARLSSYIRPILQAAHPARPASIAVFGGRLDYGRLKWWAVLFAMLIVRAPAGERRNWPAIRSWAAGLPAAFQLETGESEAHPIAD